MASKSQRGGTLPRRTARPAAPQPASRISRRGFLTAAGIAAAGAIGLVGIGAIERGGDESTPATATVGAPTTDRGRGSLTAPVTIVEYADMQCPVCARYAREVEPQIVERYVNSGLVRLEYRHFAFLGEESRRAAAATESAADQGHFLAYRDALFNAQQGESRGGFRDSRLVEIAAAIGLDRDAFSAGLSSSEHLAQIDAETAAGRAAGIRATPTFVINGQKIEGMLPFESMSQAIEQALTAAGVTR